MIDRVFLILKRNYLYALTSLITILVYSANQVMTTIYNSIRWKFIFGLNETTAATFADRLWPDAIAVRSSYQLSPTSALIYSEWNRSLRSRRHSCTCSINLHYHNILYVEWSHFSRGGGLACYLSRVHCIRRGRLSWVAAAHAINNNNSSTSFNSRNSENAKEWSRMAIQMPKT